MILFIHHHSEADVPETAQPVVTRDDQLRLKSHAKIKRGSGKKESKKKKSKKTKGGKQGKGHGDKKKRPSRKRGILQESSKKPKVNQVAGESDEDEPPPIKIRKNAPNGSNSKVSKEQPKKHSAPKAKAKASPKAKAKSQASPKSKAKGGVKANGALKAKAKAAPKPKGRAKKCPTEERIRKYKEHDLFDDETVQFFINKAKEMDEYKSGADPAFRSFCKAELPELTKYSISNIYWSRCGVGVTSLEKQSDVLHFSFNHSSAWDVYKLALALECAAAAATQRKEIYNSACTWYI